MVCSSARVGLYVYFYCLPVVCGRHCNKLAKCVCISSVIVLMRVNVPRYADERGFSACKTCDPGKQCDDPTQPPDDCLPGTRSTTAGCAACPAGQFQNVSGKADCLECATGWFAASEAQSGCLQCPVGSSCSDPTRVGTACNRGFYADKPGSTACQACPEGYSCAKARDAPDACLPGQFTDSLNHTACKACALGRFAEQAR